MKLLLDTHVWLWWNTAPERLAALPEPVAAYVARRLATDDIRPLSVTIDHAAAAETLDLLHRDPFDRLLIIQARHEGLRLLTSDDQVLAYGVPAVDARA